MRVNRNTGMLVDPPFFCISIMLTAAIICFYKVATDN